MSPVEQEGLYTGRWNLGMELYYPERRTRCLRDTNLQVPQFSKLERSIRKGILYYTE